MDVMNRINVNDIPERLQNGFIGRRVDGSSVMYLDLGDVVASRSNQRLFELMIDGDSSSSWDQFCDAICRMDSDLDPRGRVHIDYLVIDGVPRAFH
tara:strand:- start:85 stop:372 length:288 start_codon:yes stop_codon:yes gene_type:complete